MAESIIDLFFLMLRYGLWDSLILLSSNQLGWSGKNAEVPPADQFPHSSSLSSASSALSHAKVTRANFLDLVNSKSRVAIVLNKNDTKDIQ